MTKRLKVVLGLAAALVVGAILVGPFGVVAQVSGPVYAPDGTRQQPAYNFATSPRLGLFRIEKDNLGFVADGQIIYHYTASRLHILSGVELRVGGPLYVQSALGVGTDTPTAALHVIGGIAATGTLNVNGLALSTVSSNLLAAPDNTYDLGQSGTTRFRDAFLARNLHVTGYSHLGGIVTFGVHSVTIADNGTGNGNAEIMPGHVAATLRVECLDTQGCMLRFAEDGVSSGAIIRFVNVGATSLFVLDHATAGTRQHVATTFTAAKNQTMQLIFLPDTSGIPSWYELSRSAN
jgi:hypothetical protein